MNQLTLDLTNPEIADALKECNQGDRCELTVSGNVSKKDDKTAVIDIDDVKYDSDEGPEGSDSEEASESPAAEAAEGDAPTASGKKTAPAIALVMAKK